MTFSEQLVTLRKQKGLSQEQLGEEIGVSRQTVSKWESGSSTPEMDKLIQLSNFFDVSVDYLVGRNLKDNSRSETNTQHSNIPLPFFWHYEYKSKAKLFGLPLVHINVGRGMYKAKGIIAIGTIARGIIALGVISMGIISLGAISLGFIALGAAALGLLFSVGGISVGSIAVGGFAIGILAIGGCALGIYSIGGCAIASKIAAGGYANAPIAIGDKATGLITFDIHGYIQDNAIYNAILQKFPNTWQFIAELFNMSA